MTDDRMTIGDRYARAMSSGNLTLTPGSRTDADHLLAAGYAARKNKRGLMALAVYRMRATEDRAPFAAAAEAATDWLVGRGARAGGKAKLSRTEAHATAQSVLLWWLNDVCIACEGRRYTQVPGTPHLTATVCPECHGTGLQPIERVIRARHLDQARWLASEFDAMCGYVMADMAKLLADRMEL